MFVFCWCALLFPLTLTDWPQICERVFSCSCLSWRISARVTAMTVGFRRLWKRRPRETRALERWESSRIDPLRFVIGCRVTIDFSSQSAMIHLVDIFGPTPAAPPSEDPWDAPPTCPVTSDPWKSVGQWHHGIYFWMYSLWKSNLWEWLLFSAVVNSSNPGDGSPWRTRPSSSSPAHHWGANQSSDSWEAPPSTPSMNMAEQAWRSPARAGFHTKANDSLWYFNICWFFWKQNLKFVLSFFERSFFSLLAPGGRDPFCIQEEEDEELRLEEEPRVKQEGPNRVFSPRCESPAGALFKDHSVFWSDFKALVHVLSHFHRLYWCSSERQRQRQSRDLWPLSSGSSSRGGDSQTVPHPWDLPRTHGRFSGKPGRADPEQPTRQE